MTGDRFGKTVKDLVLLVFALSVSLYAETPAGPLQKKDFLEKVPPFKGAPAPTPVQKVEEVVTRWEFPSWGFARKVEKCRRAKREPGRAKPQERPGEGLRALKIESPSSALRAPSPGGRRPARTLQDFFCEAPSWTGVAPSAGVVVQEKGGTELILPQNLMPPAETDLATVPPVSESVLDLPIDVISRRIESKVRAITRFDSDVRRVGP